jgi:hypothetical protein
MKTKSFHVILLLILCVLFQSNEVKAQKRTVVVRSRPARTTVVVKRIPRHRVVYVNRRIVRPVLRVLPTAAVLIVHGNARYHYHSGCYYIEAQDGYRAVAPPVGLVVATLPPHFTRVSVRSGSCFYFGGVFYEEVAGGFRTIESPVGVRVLNLPEDAEMVTVNKNRYYEFNGTLYKNVQTEDGIAYEVSGVINNEL